MQIKSSAFHSPNPNDDLYICPRGDRWYEIPHAWAVDVLTDCGRISVVGEAGFLFDGRSGGVCADLIAPNLGTQAETKAWFKHDLFGHGLILDFEQTNEMLRIDLRESCGYSRERAGAIHKAVGVSDDWFGEPLPGDRSHGNLKLVKARWFDK